MFKEIKGIASTPNAIKNEAEIRRLIADVRARFPGDGWKYDTWTWTDQERISRSS